MYIDNISVLESENVQDLAFASNMVQKLNLILITSPELAEFRKRLKTLETRVSVFHRNTISSLIDIVARRPGAIHHLVSFLVP
jgi:hypothetical protein